MNNPATKRFYTVKRRANSKKIPMTLTKEQFEKITSLRCVYCGQFSTGRSYTGIDRLDSQLGYTLENSVPCCQICNRAKGKLPEEEFQRHVKKIFYYWARKGRIKEYL